MMYWDYPEIREADRLERAAPLDGSQLHLSPQAAYRRLGIGQPPEGGDLAMINGRPVYRFRFGFGDQRIVYAENECNYCARCQTGGRLLADRSLSRLLKDDRPKRLET